MAEVTLENIVKIYPGGVRAVDNIDLTIRDREFVVLVGPSGCGKSTTLRMIAGLEDITEGRIRIGDRIINGVAPKDRDIAMVFQNYALYPHMTVFKNMAFGLMLRREHAFWDNFVWRLVNPPAHRRAREERKAIADRVRNTAGILGIEDLLDRRPKALSGGQRQRVALGRAIVRQPKAYLFDEPLSNLDAKLRVEMRAELKRIHRKVNTTTVYVTHDQEEAMTLGDRVVVMKDGVIHQCDTPFEVYDRPVDRFVASFVGTPPMNFIDGRIVPHGDGLAFSDGKNRILVSEIHRPRLEAWVNRSVTMGVRPEALSVAKNGGDGHPVIRIMVNVVEPLGDRMDVYGNTENNIAVVCRVGSGSIVKEGEPIDMQVDSDRVHFFDLDGAGRNLCLS